MFLQQGSFQLFRLAGITVFLHWSWFLVAIYEINLRAHDYSSILWNALEYLALFAIVLMHEFGHSLACRQVGGTAERIVLWPLGGVAFVAPPQRPGAILWSIAAGPLVNVVLLPVFMGLGLLLSVTGLGAAWPDASTLLRAIAYINLILLLFNLLPVYPLDGGQILRSLLWFGMGPARSLIVTTIVGFVGVALLIVLATYVKSIWLGILAGFILLNCWQGLQQGLAMVRFAKAPRRNDVACPICRSAPRIGAYWMCGRCRKSFDTFETGAVCPHCNATYDETRCPECGNLTPHRNWTITPPPIPGNPAQDVRP